MNIYIITMEDPVFNVDFIKEIIRYRSKDIKGIAITKGGRLKIAKNHSKVKYLLSLLLIMGFYNFFRNTLITLYYRFRKSISKYINVINDISLAGFAESFKIPVIYINSPNINSFILHLREIQPDIIIHQSQYIIKKELIEIPKVGILNRHNSLLPRNRGRLTPFWVLFNNEKENGVTIHFVNENIDSGPIVIQKSYSISRKDTFNSISRENYNLAASAMLEALTMLESNKYNLIENNDDLATYNSIPTLYQAFLYRWRLIRAS